MSLAAGTRLGPYEVLGLIGTGGMGEVYKARDTRLDRTVAIKVLPSDFRADPDSRARFKREAKAIAALNHPNIVTIYDIDSSAGAEFIAMEYVPGAPLHQTIPASGLPVDHAISYGVQLAGAMAAVHAGGIVHRDLKPANILVTASGLVKVLDFGLAKLAGPIAADASTRIGLAGSEQGWVFAGTPGYAAPEQVEGKPVDARSDVFAVGAVLYEMLAGEQAFQGSTAASKLAAVLHAPPRLRDRREDIPPDLHRIVGRCLEQDPDGRYPSAVELLADLTACHARLSAPRIRVGAMLRHPAVMATLLALTVVFVAGGAWLWLQRSRASWARMEALPEAARLIEQGKTYAAFRLLRQAGVYLPDDPTISDLLSESTTAMTVQTEPVGARVYIRDFFDDPHAWEFVGTTPLDGLRVPNGTLVWRIALEGFEPKEVLAFSATRNLKFSLEPPGEANTREMVHVRGGRYELFSTPAVQLDDYWIDKYEVTNRQFRAFVDRGGYDAREYWSEEFVSDGRRLSWEEVRQLFRDRTGRPGAATWQFGTYPDGEADHPVSGVSWYEAAAFCASLRKQLPTLYHWYHAAALGTVTEFAEFSNFVASGTARVGHPLRIGAHGTYDMAGNVKEWCWNSADATRRYIAGGGWNEPSYMFAARDAQHPLERAATYGFRCALYGGPLLTASLTDAVESPSRDYRGEIPADDDTFAIYESFYRYDSTPLDSRVESIDNSPQHWRIERVSFAAAYGGERVPALLLLPTATRPPYQAIVYFPGAGPWKQRVAPRELGGELYWVMPMVRSGRAVIFPVYKGMYERHAGPMDLPHIWRDVIIQSAKDLRRAVDYLETRPDIDAQKLAFFGLSTGAGLGPIMTAVEPRFKASILLGGGLDFRRRLPESDAFNFVPRVKVATLLLNGRHDFLFPVETSQKPMFGLLGTPPADKQRREFASGHVPTERLDVMREMLDWLDRYLGPVAAAHR